MIWRLALAGLMVLVAAEKRSGYQDASPETRAMQDDDASNPGFLWVKQGEALWSQPAGSAGRSCADCHGAAPSSMRGVAVRYRLHDGEVRFELGPYDRRLPLVIDPVLSYATYAGGSGTDIGNAIAVDAAGNSYLAGNSNSPDFPALKGVTITGLHGFVARLDSSGANFTSMAAIGGASIEGIALDSNGNLVVTGSITDAAQFPGATAGAYQAGAAGFVASTCRATKPPGRSSRRG